MRRINTVYPVRYRQYAKVVVMQKEKQLKKYVKDAVCQVKEYIDQHPLEKINIDDLASEYGITRKVLQTVFKLLFGKKIKEYTVIKRLEAGQILLLEGRLTREQIAARCGYKSGSNFNTAFKTHYKQTPANWIRQQDASNTNA